MFPHALIEIDDDGNPWVAFTKNFQEPPSPNRVLLSPERVERSTIEVRDPVTGQRGTITGDVHYPAEYREPEIKRGKDGLPVWRPMTYEKSEPAPWQRLDGHRDDIQPHAVHRTYLVADRDLEELVPDLLERARKNLGTRLDNEYPLWQRIEALRDETSDLFADIDAERAAFREATDAALAAKSAQEAYEALKAYLG